MRPREAIDAGPSGLAQLAVALLAGRPCDLSAGARRACDRRLAAIYLAGLAARGGEVAPDARRELALAARREAGDEARSRRETAEILDALAGLPVAPWKGRALAALWPPAPARPPGDLDLILPAEALADAAARLEAHGFTRAPVEHRARFRPLPVGLELWPPPGRATPVDLHTRPFRSVGERIDGAALLARCSPGLLDGHPVRMLDPADRLLLVFVHAAKHAARSPKWLLDLAAVARAASPGDWASAAGRARDTGSARALWAAARLAADLPSVPVPPALLDELAPPPLARAALARLLTVDGAAFARPRTTAEGYAIELLLEPSLAARLRRVAGVVEARLARLGSRGNQRPPGASLE